MSQHTTPTCPNCGASTPAGASFCPSCGRSLTTAAPPDAGQRAAGSFQSTPLSAQDARTWAVGAHVSAIGTALFGGVSSFVGPLVVWLIRRDSDPFVAEHALEALNFNITVDLFVIASIVVSVLTIGLAFLILGPLLLVLGVLWLVWTIQAASAASRGESYRYPLSIRLVS